MQNFLVPFDYLTFQTNEAVWDFNKKETVKMFRMTRRGIGEFLHPESRDPQKIIDNIISKIPHLREASLPLAVRGKTGQVFEAETYDIWGVYQICVESDLPRAKEFLRRFPTFMEALFAHRIMPPAIGDVRPEILAYNGVPHNQKAAYRQQVLTTLGWTWHKFFRETKKAEKMLGLTVVNKRRKRIDTGTSKYPDLQARARQLKAENPTMTNVQIAALLNHPAAYKENIMRWLRAA